jgi:RNA 2',3'-cyclic 3'-phosphodiesterase
MRLFVALDIDETIRQRIAQFIDGVRGFAPEARWAKTESLHVTLKFIGEQSPEMAANIEHALAWIEVSSININFRGYGFFPSGKAPRVFWSGIEAGAELTALAKTIDEKLSALAIPKEAHAYTPHLTLARGGRGSGSPHRQKGDRRNSTFQHLQEKLASKSVPEFGSMTAHEFFLYESRLSRDGSQYTKLKRFPLR